MAKKPLAQIMAEKGYICGHFPSIGKDYYFKASSLAFIPPFDTKDKLVTVVNGQGQEITVLTADLSKALGAEDEAE